MLYAIVYNVSELQEREFSNRFGNITRLGTSIRFSLQENHIKELAGVAKYHNLKWDLGSICPKCGTDKVNDLFKGNYCPKCNDWV